jgi:transposase
VEKHGAPSTGSIENPNSRLGLEASPHLQGRVMEQPTTSPSFIGIDVSKDRLDVHVRPSGETFAIANDGKGFTLPVGMSIPSTGEAPSATPCAR